MGKINMDRKYTRQTSFYPTRPNPFDARINSGENHKIQCSVNRKTKNSFIFLATLELLMIKQMNSNMDESDTNM